MAHKRLFLCLFFINVIILNRIINIGEKMTAIYESASLVNNLTY